MLVYKPNDYFGVRDRSAKCRMRLRVKFRADTVWNYFHAKYVNKLQSYSVSGSDGIDVM